MILDLLDIFLRAAVCVFVVIFLTRMNGLRSFSKMSSFDFAITVACGSIIASSVISPKESLLYGIVALIALFVVQAVVSRARVSSPSIRTTVDNAPVLIMRDGVFLENNLSKCGLTEADVFGKLREANAFDLSGVKAVVFEPTGDISVLHGQGDVSARVMEGVLE